MFYIFMAMIMGDDYLSYCVVRIYTGQRVTPLPPLVKPSLIIITIIKYEINVSTTTG